MVLCNDPNEAANTLGLFRKWVYSRERETWISDCPVPCQQTVYEIKLKYYHLNNRIDPNNAATRNSNTVSLRLGYETFVVEVREETLVYDTGNFLAAGDNFTNILQAPFLCTKFKSVIELFCTYSLCFYFLAKEIGQKLLIKCCMLTIIQLQKIITYVSKR